MKLNIYILYDTVISFLGTYPKSIKAYVCTHRHTQSKPTCTRMFLATVFIIARNWKQPRCQSIGKWINKLWDVLAMEYYSAIQRKRRCLCATMWMNIKASR